MLMDAMEWMRRAGVGVERADVEPSHPDPPPADAVVDVSAGEIRVRFAVEERRRAPYPNEIPRLSARQAALGRLGRPLMVVPFVSETLGPALAGAGWSWADAHGNFDLRAPHLVLRQRRTTRAPRPRVKGLPQGSGSLAIVRALVRSGEGEDSGGAATALAARAGVTQPRASQVLRRLHDLQLVHRTGRGRWRPDREALLDRFLAEYPGPGGPEQFFYSLEAPTDMAVAVARKCNTRGTIAVSADVGPDLLVAWRRPSVVVIYVKHEIDTAALGLVEANGRDDANVIVRSLGDRSVFAVPPLVAEIAGVDVPLADPSQMIWDLQELGGADRLEGAGRLREWLLTRP